MIIDVEAYRLNKPFFIQFYLDHQSEPIDYIASMLASVTHVPCYVVYYYLGEELGFTPEIVSSMNSLKRFYGYE